MYKFRWLAAMFIALAALPGAATAQETGTITGVVSDAAGAPLAGAQLRVQGTERQGLSDAQGRYTIPDVPAGSYTLTATQLGRETQNRRITVAAGQTVTANFALGTSAIELEGLVATASGQQQRVREVGNVVGQIDVAEDVEQASVNNVSDVLQGRVAGVSVLQSSGEAGAASRIRIRGSNSVTLSNDPLVIIDGIRTDVSTSSSIGTGGQDLGRLDDINQEDIESIEVLKGPAASSQYGTDAANGVIVITTKKGRSGRARFNAYTEQGSISNKADFPANFEGATAEGDFCLIAVDGPCAEIVSFNPLEDPRSQPFRTGYRYTYGLNASGGSENTTYFLSGEFQRNNGLYQKDFNTLERKNLRANIRAQLLDNFDVNVTTGYVNTDVRRPQNDNNILGLISGGLLGRVAFDSTSFGFIAVPPSQLFNGIFTNQNVERITGSANANWRPIPWLSVVGVAGVDRANRFDNETIPPGIVEFSDLPEGQRTSNRAEVTNYTANTSATAQYKLKENITATTAVGFQYTEEIFRQTEAFGQRLLAGTSSLNGTNALFSVGETNQQVKTAGGFVTHQFGLSDRLFIGGALRVDDNSAFGQDFGLTYYPSANAAWVLSEEPFFPQSLNFLSNLRLRASYGKSGLKPDFRDAVAFLSPVAVTEGARSEPGFTVGGAGNVNLRPEKSSEYELGTDIGLFQDRLGVELTYYHKTSDDALIGRRLAPSLGSSLTRLDNLGSVRNQGFEYLVNAALVDRSKFKWTASLTGSFTSNELTDIGTDPVTGERISPIIFGLGGDSQRHTEGYPLGAYFARPYTFSDANSDGIIQPDEINFTSDTAQFVGSPFPKREVSLNSTATFFNVVRISGLLDYRGNYKLFNSTEEFRCGSFLICEALFNADVPLDKQARAVASVFSNDPYGYIEDAAFVKLRELSVTLMAPENFARRLGASGLQLTFSGRNLATWTDYTGFDPEINFAGSSSNFTTAEFLTQPQARFFTARLDLNF